MIAFALLAPIVGASILAQEAPPVAPDRSGEAALRRLMRDGGAVKDAHVLLRGGRRPNPRGGILEPSRMELHYRSQKVFRFESSSFMGGGARVISDGTVVLRDPLTLNGPVELTNATEEMADASPVLRGAGVAGGLLFRIMTGEAALDKVLDAKGFVIDTVGPFGRALLLGAPNNTVAIIHFEEVGGKLWVRRIDLEQRRELPAKPPTIAEIEGANPFSLEVRWEAVGKPLPDELFSTKPPEGIPVQDRRGASGGVGEGTDGERSGPDES
jgi:hypothetical protein